MLKFERYLTTKVSVRVEIYTTFIKAIYIVSLVNVRLLKENYAKTKGNGQ
jgi:hypothetical protein